MQIPVHTDLMDVVELADSELAARHPEMRDRKLARPEDEATWKKEAELRREWERIFVFEALKRVRLVGAQLGDARKQFFTGA
jgi:hypothetical protein